MKWTVCILSAAILMAGCATKEGIKFPSGSGPTKEAVEDFQKRNSAPQTSSQASELPKDTLRTTLIPDPEGPRMIIIGNVMALTVFDDKKLGSRYDNYLKQIEARSGTPGFSREWYVATSGGETAVKIGGVTGVYSRFFKAEIPNDLIRQISFVCRPFRRDQVARRADHEGAKCRRMGLGLLGSCVPSGLKTTEGAPTNTRGASTNQLMAGRLTTSCSL